MHIDVRVQCKDFSVFFCHYLSPIECLCSKGLLYVSYQNGLLVVFVEVFHPKLAPPLYKFPDSVNWYITRVSWRDNLISKIRSFITRFILSFVVNYFLPHFSGWIQHFKLPNWWRHDVRRPHPSKKGSFCNEQTVNFHQPSQGKHSVDC